jgi:hypothetical protein
MTIRQDVWFPIRNKDIHRETDFLYWHNSLFLGALFLCLWSGEGGKDSIAFVRVMNASAVVTLGGVQVPMLGGRHRVQLVGELLLELLVRGSKPLRCWIAPRIRSKGLEPHMSNQGTLKHRYQEEHSGEVCISIVA